MRKFYWFIVALVLSMVLFTYDARAETRERVAEEGNPFYISFYLPAAGWGKMEHHWYATKFTLINGGVEFYDTEGVYHYFQGAVVIHSKQPKRKVTLDNFN